MGIAVGPTDGDSPDQLLRNADLALYRAKNDGRGTFRFFERGMDRAVAAMAKGLGMMATAEGVETPEQLKAVRSEGCGEVQGYFFSKPMPASEIQRIYASDCVAGRRTATKRG